MAGAWDDEELDNDSPASPPLIARRSKWDDEEGEDDVLDSWDAAEDSEVEREKAKKAEEAKKKAEEEAKKNHKSKSQRILERREENMRRRLEEEAELSDSDEDEASKRARLLAEQKESDLKHAADLFGDMGIDDQPAGTEQAGAAAKPATKKAAAPKASEDIFAGIGVSANRAAGKHITIEAAPGQTVDLSTMPLFKPNTKDEFTKLRDTLVPLLAANSKKAQYGLFMQEFAKQIVKELPSDQIRKVASGLTTMANEKMKEEKAAEKGGKKSKAAKTKASLAGGRDMAFKADTNAYDDGLDDDDFM